MTMRVAKSKIYKSADLANDNANCKVKTMYQSKTIKRVDCVVAKDLIN